MISMSPINTDMYFLKILMNNLQQLYKKDSIAIITK